MFEVIGSSVQFDHVDGLVMLGVHRFGLSRSSQVVKRTMDVCGAALALVIAAPVMALVALAIRLEGPGPILYRQKRVGRNGQLFTMLKFRTMVPGAHQLREELRALSSAGDGMFKVRDDPRVTKVGRFLRKTSLDELPQFINVLGGEMSLVGPRPLVIDEDARIAGWHRRRLDLTPGLTGPWQVLGSRDNRVPLRDMVTIDYLYAANWSIWSDVKVLLRTVAHVCRAKGV
jgi:lipopolysaccharide/colanic/teichoic acid biosynthesis glycosyltransferase